MGLDLSNWNLGAGLDFPSTMDAGVPDYSVGNGVPATAPLENVPLSSGIDLSGILGGITKTAETGLNLFSKIYSLQDSVESAKFNRAMQQTRTDIAKAQASGALDVQRLQVDANTQLAKLQAQRAIADAQAQLNSSSASGYYSKGAGLSAYVPLLLIGGIVYAVAKGKK